VQRWKPDAFVVGMPYNMDGTDSHSTTRARQFGTKLEERYQRPVHGVDERLSTRSNVFLVDEPWIWKPAGDVTLQGFEGTTPAQSGGCRSDAASIDTRSPCIRESR
jgi:hypothetical protein